MSKMVKKASEMSDMPCKTMYQVEKFLPPSCPKCNHPFQREVRGMVKTAEGDKPAGDYSMLFGDIVDGCKVIRETTGYNIIVCNHCQNFTARIPLETYSLGDKEKAEKLVAEQGFQNLTEVMAYGNMARDHHAIMGKMPELTVRDLMKDDPDDLRPDVIAGPG
jgi:hypothetical protein